MVQKVVIIIVIIFLSINSFIVPASALSKNANGDTVTNKLMADLDLSAERFSDVKVVTTGPKSFKDDQLKVSNSDGRVNFDLPLGDQTDERDGCVELKNNRRVGICEDGIYTSTISSFDAGGNKSEDSKFRIERDTVIPFIDSVNIKQVINKLNFTIKAEANSEVFINQISLGFANSNGNFNYDQFIICGIDYTFKVYSKDLAGNVSAEKVEKFKTSYCGIGGGGEVLGGSKDDEFGGQSGDTLADPNRTIGKLIIDRDSNGKIIKYSYEIWDIAGPAITFHRVNFDGTITVWGINYYPGQVLGNLDVDDRYPEQDNLSYYEKELKEVIKSDPEAFCKNVLKVNDENLQACIGNLKNKYGHTDTYATQLKIQNTEAELKDSDTTKLILSSPDGKFVSTAKLDEFPTGTNVTITGKYKLAASVGEINLKVNSIGTEIYLPSFLENINITNPSPFIPNFHLERRNHREKHDNGNISIIGNSVNIGAKPVKEDFYPKIPPVNMISVIISQTPFCNICYSHGGLPAYDLARRVTVDVPVIASIDGTLSLHFEAGGFGNYIRLENDFITIIYGHLDERTKEMVKEVNSVKAGEVIGIMGTTGNSTGIHLHYELRIKENGSERYANNEEAVNILGQTLK